MEVACNGPFLWPKPRENSPLRGLSGVYLMTVEGTGGFMVYGCGLTKRPVAQRLSEHRRAMLSGRYTLFNIDAMRRGIRSELWHGMWAGYNSPDRQQEFLRRETELRECAQNQMDAFRIFVLEIGGVRLQHRAEAAVMRELYAAPKPYCDLPDRGMHLVPRRKEEDSISIVLATTRNFLNLQHSFDI